MISKAFAKTIGFAGYLFLTGFAGLMIFLSLGCLVACIIHGDFIDVIGCLFFGLAGTFCWLLRKNTLV